MKVLVTGGNGFLGRRVVKLLQDTGVDCRSYDNLDPLCGGVRLNADTFFAGDVCDMETLDRVVTADSYTHIVHLAAYGRNLTCQDYPWRAHAVNVGGTENVLEVARRRNLRAVICSSNIVLSDQPTVYRMTKREVEGLVRSFAAAGCDCLCLRPSNIYGPGQSKTEYQPCAFAGLDAAYAKTGKFTITGDGTQTRDWVHVDDVARAFYMALNHKLTGATLDICTGEQVSLNEIAKLLGVQVEYTDPRPGDAKAIISDPRPAAQLLGFEAEIKLKDRILDAFPSVERRVHV